MEQQLFFISSIAGILLLANIMGYYIFKFKRNFEAEQASRIKHKTTSERLKQELNTTQAELAETQVELEQKQNEANCLEENLQEERESWIIESEQLQCELDTTQEELQENKNKVNRLENGTIERRTLVRILTQKNKNKVNCLENNLEAEREARIQYETESERLQLELKTTQEELGEKENEVNHLEESLEAKRAESEKLQHELKTIQEELKEQKKKINRLEQKIKEKSDNRASTEQSDIQEVEENSTDSDKPQNQENTGVEPDSQKDSARSYTTETKNKTYKTGRIKAPQNREGQRGNGSNIPEGGTDHQAEYSPKPELVCRNNRGQWEILLTVPEEQRPVAVQQKGVSLPGFNGEHPLKDFSADLTIVGSEERVKLHYDNSPLIFKLQKKWKGEGRKVRDISRGYFIVFTPNEWERTGSPSVAKETCSDRKFSAHYFYSDGSTTTDGFEGHELPSNREAFSLKGSSIHDDSDQGLLFVGDPPDMKLVKEVFWARIGAEGGDNWRGKNFKPAEQTVKKVLNGRQGWFYVRVYDEAVQLMDSGHFRYSQTLKEIRVDGTIYSEEILLVPFGGHRKTTIQFIDTQGNNIRPEEKGSSSHTSINDDGTVIVNPHPEGDLTTWKVAGIDTVIALPRVWWRITETEESSEEWQDTPIAMSREKFLDNTDAVVQISLPSNINKIKAGFGFDLDRSYNPTANDENENKHIFELPIREFVDYKEIEKPSSKDTHLKIQCARREMSIICVPAEELPLEEIRVNGTIYQEEMLLVPSDDGYTGTTIQFIDTQGNNIRPKQKGNNSHTSIGIDGAVIVNPHPEGDLTAWKVGSGKYDVDKIITLPRVWWRIKETETWRDTPIVMSHTEFRENTDVFVQISLPSNIQRIQVGFGFDLDRSYNPTANDENENKHIFELPIRDFVNCEQIRTQLLEDTYLQIQCNEEEIPVICVPAERCAECDSTQITQKRYPTEQRIELFCRTCEHKWLINNTIVSIAEPQSSMVS